MIYYCNWGFGAQMILATARMFLYQSVFDYWNGKLYLSAGVVVVQWDSSSGRCHWATCRGGGGCSRGSCARPWQTSSEPGPGSRPLHRPRLPRPRPQSWSRPNQRVQTSTMWHIINILWDLVLDSWNNRHQWPKWNQIIVSVQFLH